MIACSAAVSACEKVALLAFGGGAFLDVPSCCLSDRDETRLPARPRFKLAILDPDPQLRCFLAALKGQRWTSALDMLKHLGGMPGHSQGSQFFFFFFFPVFGCG